MSTSAREKRLWRLAALYTLVVYLSLPWVRVLTDFLRERNRLALSVSLVFLLAGVALVRWLVRRRPGWRQLAVLGAVALAYAVAMLAARSPEEKLHLVQYGVLGLICHNALTERKRWQAEAKSSGVSFASSPALSAVLLTTAAGWVDELIQYFLPTRFYDLHDVAINAAAAVLSVGCVSAFAWAGRLDAAST